MKILITGATGFVGSHLVKSLLQSDCEYKLLLIGNSEQKAKQLFGENGFEYSKVTNIESIKRFNPDIVIHLASKLTSSNETSIINDIIDSNIKFGAFLLDALKGCNNLKIFFNFGTFAEYRLGPDKINNAYLYSATKTAFRSILEYYSELFKFKYIHIVPYTIYGGPDTQKKIIDYIIESVDSSTPIKMTKGEQVLDFINIKDVVSFILYLIEYLENSINYNNLLNGETFFLGTGKGTSIREVAKLIEENSGKLCNIEWGALPYRERDVMYAVAPISKLLALGWKCNHLIYKDIKTYLGGRYLKNQICRLRFNIQAA